MSSTRHIAVTREIHKALLLDSHLEVATRYNVFKMLVMFFSVWKIRLIRKSPQLFKSLREDVWQLDETQYIESFKTSSTEPGGEGLQALGDLGYSGSTFFRTMNSEYLIKSLPRRSEHSFFHDEFLQPYYEFMKNNPNSLLVRITDFLGVDYPTIGTICGYTPSHHVIMENILSDRNDKAKGSDKWETYDLKPVDYFYPERDLVPKPLATEALQSRLYDEFKDKIRITNEQYNELKRSIEGDTEFLRTVNTVDYSLFLVRYPAHMHPQKPAYRKIQWREGVLSVDGKWRYRAVLLDYFWAKHKFQAQAMTGVVQTFNAIGRKGPMSITTTAEEYRHNFLQMLDGLVELHE